jgi:hypothetical protein
MVNKKFSRGGQSLFCTSVITASVSRIIVSNGTAGGMGSRTVVTKVWVLLVPRKYEGGHKMPYLAIF